MEHLEISLQESADLETWEYKHFIKNEEKINILKRKRQLAMDLPLFKSDFNNDYDYIAYILLKQEQENERNNK
jgi:hypothetical protein